MEQIKAMTESIYRYTDEKLRKDAIISKVKELIERDVLSSVRLEAIACLQNEEK